MLRGNHKDRWLLTYADFITLLFATFVLMYATAKAREGTQKVSLNPIAGVAAPKPVPESKPAPEARAAQSNLLADLRSNLQLEQDVSLATISVEQRGIVI